MTHRVHPYIFRIGQLRPWKSRWFSAKQFQEYLREDTLLRSWLEKKLRHAHVDVIEMERSPNNLEVIIKTSRPGILIGRGGEGIEKLKADIEQYIHRLGRRPRMYKETEQDDALVPKKRVLKLTVEEVRAPETHAGIAAQLIADDIEKRIPFRRAIKSALEKIASSRDVKGVKIAMKGRLDGAEMARYEWLKKGRIPLQTIRADVDYAEKTAFTTYGTVGIKVWIYKGDIFEREVTIVKS